MDIFLERYYTKYINSILLGLSSLYIIYKYNMPISICYIYDILL